MAIVCLLQVALDKLFRFATSHVFETEVAGRMCADMCAAAAKVMYEFIYVFATLHVCIPYLLFVSLMPIRPPIKQLCVCSEYVCFISSKHVFAWSWSTTWCAHVPDTSHIFRSLFSVGVTY